MSKIVIPSKLLKEYNNGKICKSTFNDIMRIDEAMIDLRIKLSTFPSEDKTELHSYLKCSYSFLAVLGLNELQKRGMIEE